MTCKKCWQQGHNTRGCKNEKCDPPPKEKRRIGRPAKAQSEAQSSQVTGTGTSSLTNAASQANPRAPTSLPLQVRKTIAKERALARKGIGTMVTESGNIYVRGSTKQRGSIFINPKKVSELPSTQESGNDGV
ncbi:uncharacterized protein LOC131021437 isoform X2 [Salvia miltiorrhiza]|uniref:uncharacterized protein LOC131021437 isoform X2 n=1 Tax=Salvia miltiorrhiza TaxID=226208 RepID=UPI0025AD7EBF|nr:uncharacterized protein LOC131021437 isoform X2 [Salvia miltiorrhiza]